MLPRPVATYHQVTITYLVSYARGVPAEQLNERASISLIFDTHKRPKSEEGLSAGIVLTVSILVIRTFQLSKQPSVQTKRRPIV